MIKKINIAELKIGMYVSGLEKQEPGNVLFFMNNILVRNEEDIQRFHKNGYKSVYIELDDEDCPLVLEEEDPVKASVDAGEPASEIPIVKEEDAAVIEECAAELKEEEAGQTVVSFAGHTAKLEEIAKEERGDTEKRDFNEELTEARKIQSEAESLAREFLNSVKRGGEIKAEKVHDAVGKMVNSVFRNQDALTSLSKLKSFDDYTFSHSVNVCILSLTLGRHMGLGKEDLHDLGVGAILHDVGKMLVPEMILKKPGKLTETEFLEMKKHSMFGSEVLSKTKEICEASRSVALQHHERYDGSGYQGGLAGRDIHLFARIAAVADVYDAMTSNRVYQKGFLPEEALKRMYLMRGTHFEPELVERLIKCLGIYPIGTVVELNTGEICVVRMTNHSHPLQPVVMMLFDKNKKQLAATFDVDLKDEIGRWIVASKDPDTLGVMIDTLTA